MLRAQSQLNGGSPEFPCIETCHAILELGKMYESANKKLLKANESVEYGWKEIERLSAKVEELAQDVSKVRKDAANNKFLNSVAFSFIRDISENEYDGKEAVTAKRIFDLHKDDLGIKLMRCHKFNGAGEAKSAFAEWCKRNGVEATDARMVEWLLSTV